MRFQNEGRNNPGIGNIIDECATSASHNDNDEQKQDTAFAQVQPAFSHNHRLQIFVR